MKILYFAPANSIHSHKWINFFVDRGHDIYWISLHDSKFDLPDKVNFYQINLKKISFILELYKLSIYLSSKKIDIMHVHSVGLYGFVSLFFDLGKKVSTTWGSDIIFSEKNILKKPFIRKVLNRSDVITCDAEHMIRRLQGFDIIPQKIKRINFGVDTQFFSRKAISVKSNDIFKIVSIRNLEPVYDIPTLLNAVQFVINKNSNVEFLIGGSGSLENQLKDQVKELKIEQYVNFIGSVPFARLPEFFSSADVYVSTSLSDAGLASSTAEAMSCELCVVITDSGENNLWIEDSVNGLIVPIKDPEAISDAIIKLLTDKVQRKEMGIAGRKTIVERNDFNNEMMKVEQIYFDLLG